MLARFSPPEARLRWAALFVTIVVAHALLAPAAVFVPEFLRSGKAVYAFDDIAIPANIQTIAVCAGVGACVGAIVGALEAVLLFHTRIRITLPIILLAAGILSCLHLIGALVALPVELLLAIVFNAMPALNERLPTGQCTTCGYDVRATRGARCPECGSVIAGTMRR
ncbi:hypothetical protein BH11PLA1_BH11PLA1_17150 [soil metagenome]